MNGLHLIGDLNGCRCEPSLLLDAEQMREQAAQICRDADLTVLDARFHQFDEAGFTGLVLLAESHVAIHTWPEKKGLTLDVYVCNYMADNSAKARAVFDALVALYQPTEVARQAIERGQHVLTEPLNDSTGFYIKANALLGEQQTRFQKLQVYETSQYGKLLRLDGYNMTSERDEFVYHENLIHPAASAHAGPKNVLIIGGGDGGSAEEVLKHPSVERVTLVEIDADVIKMAKEHFAAVHHGVFDNPKLSVRIEDGLRFMRESRDKYDLIVLDLNDPMGPAEALYSTDFFQHCRAALSPGGALTLHIGSPVARPERVTEISGRLNSVFRIVRPYIMYVPLYGSLWAMACASDKLDPKSFTADEIDRRIEHRKLIELQYYNGETHEGVFALPNFVRDMVAPPRLRQPARGRRLGVVRNAAS